MRLFRLACAGCLLSACDVVPPTEDAGTASGKTPGTAFSENVCFQCSLRSCAGPANACTYDAFCSEWLRCVSACPTNKTGVSAEADCVLTCGLPVSAEVFRGCIQDYANGLLLGCEQACEELAADAGAG